ncbi:lantibiotic dehydratase [Mycobacterium sp. 852013-51886_SCH5428379]|uniref:lantibiotic dehydratase n=1 Tax=Mycobacterium sp. 852013-51886_SCH5428379 TaxID=1834111 RepID=UPI000AF411E8|nr:lantibiotic dehydratase [Mycobacterium sp. 852013-51886_SCH5428379]
MPDTSASRPRGWYLPGDWFMLRAPALPVDVYRDMSTWPANALSDPDRRGRVVADRRVMAALTVGSPDTVAALTRAGQDPDPALAQTLHRYLIRMSTRPTPFGLFAGVALGCWGSQTTAAVDGRRWTTRMRPDMAWLMGQVDELETDPGIQAGLRYTANAALLDRGGRLSAPASPEGREDGAAAVASVRATGAVRSAVRLCRRPMHHADLVAALTDQTSAPRQKVVELIGRLVRHQILLTDLRPPLTGGDPLAHVISTLTDIPAAQSAADGLCDLAARMARWDRTSLGEAAVGYGEIDSASAGFSHRHAARRPQVDAALSMAGTGLSRAIGEAAAEAAELLLKLAPPAPRLTAFRQRFESVYGLERWVPILEVLDPDYGLGSPYQDVYAAATGVSERDRVLLTLAAEAMGDGQTVVDLDDALLARLTSESASDAAPVSLDLSVSVLAVSPAAIDRGDFSIAIGPNLGGAGAGKSLGRFAHLLGAPAVAALKSIVEHEKSTVPAVLSAELVYRPSRAWEANIAVRPHAREFEIAVGVTPGVAADRVIRPDELEICSLGTRFAVGYRGDPREVVVSAGHMLNEALAPPACRFLLEVARERDLLFRPFDWGAAENLPVLPALRRNRVILTPRRYRADDLSASALRAERADFIEAVERWRRRWGVSRHLYVGVVDNRLLIDLDSELHLDGLRAELRRSAGGAVPVITDALPGPQHAWLPGADGTYLSDLVVPLLRRTVRKPESNPLPRTVAPVARATRLRPPGSEWLYAKLYCPPAHEEAVICETADRFCAEMRSSALIDDWFFIRYADPDPHVRIRFRGSADVLLTAVLPAFTRWCRHLVDRDVCVRFAIDTYDREIERYAGVEGMRVAEVIFGADSRAAAGVLALERSGVLDAQRHLVTVLTTRDLLTGLGLTDGECLRWSRAAAARIGATPRPPRDDVRALRTMLGGGGADFRGERELTGILQERRIVLDTVAADVRALRQSLGARADDLVLSYAHMHYNRMMGRNRDAERVVLKLLAATLYGISQTRRPAG